MTRSRGDGPRRSIPLSRGSAPALVLLGSLSAALASDGDLQRILLEHACVKPQVETVLKQASLIAYRVNCFGTAHQVLDVVCDGHRCSASQRRGEADPP
ncbi:hypothetical protein B6S44_08290 [Bosea sp. Tri-44]|uniref:hypothetical protein n=1 Tax=Bosea sp. Tri-44 TaxID=1972137 RepID=UPI00100DC719|nr:hypothetical protein [Bosea sp. Tri-44]RXT56062.1 hypothetical protein B6S44_08290 [Bosea sp. Tri-44]